MFARSLLLVLSAALLPACRGDPAEQRSGADRSAPDSLREAPAGALSPARADAAPSASALAGAESSPPGSPSAEPAPAAADRKVYLDALAEGRAAVRDKRYREAIAAFGRALGAMPHEPRALAERGQARLLAGDLEGAAADLQGAERLGPDDRLAAHLWFNLGLIDEQRGEPARARSAFARSYLLSPTPAIKARAGSGMACGVAIEHRRRATGDVLSPRLVLATGWLDVYRQLYGGGRDPRPGREPATDAEAKRSLCERDGADRCAGHPPWVLTRHVNSALGELEDHVFAEPDGSLFVYHAGFVQRRTEATSSSRLSCVPEQRLTVRLGLDVLHVATETELRAWKGPDDPAPQACDPGQTWVEDVFYTLGTGEELVRLGRVERPGSATVKLVGRKVEIQAKGCAKSVLLDSAAAAGASAPGARTGGR